MRSKLINFFQKPSNVLRTLIVIEVGICSMILFFNGAGIVEIIKLIVLPCIIGICLSWIICRILDKIIHLRDKKRK